MSGDQKLIEFVRESNRIEGIVRDPSQAELDAHRLFMAKPDLCLYSLESFVTDVAAKPLRSLPGMDVIVGGYRPPPGGPEIRRELTRLIDQIEEDEFTPFQAHVAYETLHPFMDGNGRSGRVLWAWHMQRDGLDPFALPFLHRFYYQALDASEARNA